MRTAKLFIIAIGLLVVGVGSIASGWHGNAGVNFGIPVSATSVSFSGNANGVAALIGILGIAGGVIVFAIALIITVVQMIDRGRVVAHRTDAAQR